MKWLRELGVVGSGLGSNSLPSGCDTCLGLERTNSLQFYFSVWVCFDPSPMRAWDEWKGVNGYSVLGDELIYMHLYIFANVWVSMPSATVFSGRGRQYRNKQINKRIFHLSPRMMGIITSNAKHNKT